MATRGRLDEVAFPNLLQILADGRRTGKLTLTHRNGFGVVLLREGRVVYCACNRPREAFGSLLVSRGLISEEILREALEIQNRSHEERRLGAILVDMGALTGGDLRRIMVQQVTDVFAEFLDWNGGFFKFVSGQIPDQGEVEVDFEDLLMDDGLAPDSLLLDAITREMAGDDGPQGPGAQQLAEPDPADDTAVSIRKAMSEAQSPVFTGEIALQLLRTAADVLSRGVLFSVGPDAARGLSQFGVELGSNGGSDDWVRELEISLYHSSVVADAVTSQEPFHGPLPRTPWNEKLAEALGGAFPSEVVAIPLSIGGEPAYLLYGDNSPAGKPIGDVSGLVTFMRKAGLVMEKAALELRLEQIAARLQDPS